MANAYGSSPEVRECKFYDQSGGLIRCAAVLNGEKEQETSIRGDIRIGETSTTLAARSTDNLDARKHRE